MCCCVLCPPQLVSSRSLVERHLGHRSPAHLSSSSDDQQPHRDLDEDKEGRRGSHDRDVPRPAAHTVRIYKNVVGISSIHTYPLIHLIWWRSRLFCHWIRSLDSARRYELTLSALKWFIPSACMHKWIKRTLADNWLVLLWLRTQTISLVTVWPWTAVASSGFRLAVSRWEGENAFITLSGRRNSNVHISDLS